MSVESERIEATIGQEGAGQRLDRALALMFEEISRTRIKRLIEKGQITVDGNVEKDPTFKVLEGQCVSLILPPPIAAVPEPQNIPLVVAYEDDDLIVVDKPAGLVVHPAPGNYDGTLVNALLHHCGASLSGIGEVQRPGIVHRIDKDTSGLLVVAKNDLAHAGLSKQFANHSISRAYYALVWGYVAKVAGSVEGDIGRSHTDRKKMAVVKRNGKHARTHYKVIKRLGDIEHPLATLLDCKLETGRTHQIRVHMTHLGHPLLGDPLYGRGRQGSPKRLGEHRAAAIRTFGRQALHARLLGFYHPRTRKEIRLESELPFDFSDLMSTLESED